MIKDKDTWFKIYIIFVAFWIVLVAFVGVFKDRKIKVEDVSPAPKTEIIEKKDAVQDGSVINNININPLLHANPPTAVTYATKSAIASTFTEIPKATEHMELTNYVIRKGDTLAGLAKIFNTSVGTLERLNNINTSTPLIPNTMILIVPKITN